MLCCFDCNCIHHSCFLLAASIGAGIHGTGSAALLILLCRPVGLYWVGFCPFYFWLAHHNVTNVLDVSMLIFFSFSFQIWSNNILSVFQEKRASIVILLCGCSCCVSIPGFLGALPIVSLLTWRDPVCNAQGLQQYCCGILYIWLWSWCGFCEWNWMVVYIAHKYWVVYCCFVPHARWSNTLPVIGWNIAGDYLVDLCYCCKS